MAKRPVARSVESLKKLLAQVNAIAPKRNKASDGWIGDVKHMARHSDHNPEPDGTVDARDITNDASHGMDTAVLAEALRASKDYRISYIICNGRIMSGRKGPKPWQWRKYTGSNGHYHHMHISVLDEGQDDTTPWDIEDYFKKGKSSVPKIKPSPLPKVEEPAPKVEEHPLDGTNFPKTYKDGKVHEELKNVQLKLDELGYPEVGSADGKWGDKTATAVMAFRLVEKLPVAPDIDREFLTKLLTASPRPIAPERKNATAEDLRKEDVPEIQAADNQKLVGAGVGGVGALGALDTVTGYFESGGGIVKRVKETLDPIQTFISDNFWIIAVVVGAFLIYQSGWLTKLRVKKHQTGQDVSR
jgi:peptidoglycan hydrolase-like protein with peptidoglycan-binding domain